MHAMEEQKRSSNSAMLSWLLLIILGYSCLSCFHSSAAAFDYKDALTKSILYFEAQRSGTLPPHQRATWRANSGLQDGKNEGIDLVGGYYDAGDHVKYGLPMAFAMTMLSWSVIEYEKELALSGELVHALEAIKWGTDYFIKAHPEPNVLWGEVGEGMSDHYCWQRPEEMTTPRSAYKIDSSNPGSDLAGETAAAMAAASILFRSSDNVYAETLLWHAKQLFTFADTYEGKYDNSIPVAKKYYQSASGYDDELLWAALWLYKANGGRKYLDYAMNNAASLGGTQWAVKEMSWDIKYAGVQVLASKMLLQAQEEGYKWALEQYQSKAQYFLCASLQKNRGDNVQMTPGKLLYTREWNNLQYVTTASFLLMLYSDSLSSANQQLQCPDGKLSPSEIFSFAQSQVDYILGQNPKGLSYMVGVGENYPRQVHHRGASIVSIKQSSNFVSCQDGFQEWYDRSSSNPNPIVGAVVGGPDQNDGFSDERNNYEQTEPTLYTNSPLVGMLARLATNGH